MMFVTVKDGDDGSEPEPIDPQELPEFSRSQLATAGVIAGAMPSVAVLVLFNLLALAGAFIAIQRYDLR